MISHWYPTIQRWSASHFLPSKAPVRVTWAPTGNVSTSSAARHTVGRPATAWRVSNATAGMTRIRRGCRWCIGSSVQFWVLDVFSFWFNEFDIILCMQWGWGNSQFIQCWSVGLLILALTSHAFKRFTWSSRELNHGNWVRFGTLNMWVVDVGGLYSATWYTVAE